MKKHLLFATAVMAMGCLIISCSSSDADVEEESSPKAVVYMLSDPQPVILSEEQRVFVNDNNDFALNFLRTVNETDRSGKSFIYSPLSITYVLGMVNDAATGLTEQELEQTLGFHKGGIKAVNEYCKNLIDNLPKVDSKVTLDIANAIFVNQDLCQLQKQYEQDMQTYYDAKAEALDFSSPKTLNHINDWCKQKTHDMIPEILDKVDPTVLTYLLNAIYFKADWTSKFDPKNTKNETFTTENGAKTRLPMMHQTVLIDYTENDTYSAITIPYGNKLWQMILALPVEGKTTDDIIRQLDIQDNPYGALSKDGMTPYEIDLKLPCYETSSDTDELKGNLIGLLKKMGIIRAFDSDFAEIPNMCQSFVYISKMRQKARIKVNEEGSEAAAVTIAALNKTTTANITPVIHKADFHANRPFVYLIREASSGVILFVGKYTGE